MKARFATIAAKITHLDTSSWDGSRAPRFNRACVAMALIILAVVVPWTVWGAVL